jgi:hypothetical protein
VTIHAFTVKFLFSSRHEKAIHGRSFKEMTCDTIAPQADNKIKEDYIYNYHRGKLAFGLLLFEFNDAIKEGDGQRLYELYKLALLMYKAYGKTKYSYVVLLYLVKISGILSENDSHNLKWNRFFNKHGKLAANIPLDLRMEQLNKCVKSMWRGLGANVNETSASRLARTTEYVEMILDSIDRDCDIGEASGYRSSGKSEVAVKQIATDLLTIRAFKHQPGRNGHNSFPKFPCDLLKKLDYRDLHSWMSGLVKTWYTFF